MPVQLEAIFQQMPDELGLNKHSDIFHYDIVAYSKAGEFTLVDWRWGAPPPEYEWMYGQNFYRRYTLIKAVGGALFQPTGKSRAYDIAHPWNNVDVAKGEFGISTATKKQLLDRRNRIVLIRH